MKSKNGKLRRLVEGMREAFARGENAMAWARANEEISSGEVIDAALIAYDLQAGSYVALARKDPDYRRKWCTQLAGLIKPWIEPGDRLLEVGAGEATTLSGVVSALQQSTIRPLGFDLCWSRLNVGREWLRENSVNAGLFVADLFNIPLANDSIDVVYTSHSLEPNGGREREAIAECLRIARKAVVLVEPLYELAPDAAKERMNKHGYVRNLRQAAIDLGAEVKSYRLLDLCANPLNPSGVLVLAKVSSPVGRTPGSDLCWQCPVTGAAMLDRSDLYYAPDVGLAYPVIRGIPLLRPEHVIVASRLGATSSP